MFTDIVYPQESRDEERETASRQLLQEDMEMSWKIHKLSFTNHQTPDNAIVGHVPHNALSLSHVLHQYTGDSTWISINMKLINH